MSLRQGPIHASGLIMRRTGVTASEIVSRFSVVAPVENVMAAMGSGPRRFITAPQMRIPSGQRQAIQVSVLRRMIFERDMRSLAVLAALAGLASHPGLKLKTWGTHSFKRATVNCEPTTASVVLLQVHSVIQRRYLFGVAVEHESSAALVVERQADAALGILAPAGMVHAGIHVGVEAVLLGSLLIPGGGRLLVEEAHRDDGLGGLEAIFPRHHDAHRRTVLVGQHFAIEPEGEQRERVHGFVHAQAFGIWPEDGRLAGPLLDMLVVVGEELDVFRTRQWVAFLDEFRKRIADPRNHHAPRLDAAVAIDAVLERAQLQQ